MITHPTPPAARPPAPQPRRRAQLTLAAMAVAAAVVLVAAALSVIGLSAPDTSPSATTAPAPTTPTPHDGGWDWAGEAALARQPMPAMPVEAARPQPLAAAPAPGVITLPHPTGEIAGVAAGFPQTPAGAVAALGALTSQGLRGGDPQVYAAAYTALSAPGAPPASATRLVDLLTSLRTRAGVPGSGPVPDLTMGWQMTEGQVKGVLDDGRYAAVCVLGQFSVSYQGRIVTAGVGDCQAMRWDTISATAQWRISPGPGAARAADAWPGSQDAITAGYQEVQ